MAHEQAPKEGKNTTPTMVLKKGPVATAEKDLIVEVAWPEDGLLIAGKKMGAGMGAASNGETVLENKDNISSSVFNTAYQKGTEWQILKR